MTKTIAAHFDGKTIVPDEPVELPVGQTLLLRIEVDPDAPPLHADLLKFAGMIDDPSIPSDLGQQHDHYLYGTPKR